MSKSVIVLYILFAVAGAVFFIYSRQSPAPTSERGIHESQDWWVPSGAEAAAPDMESRAPQDPRASSAPLPPPPEGDSYAIPEGWTVLVRDSVYDPPQSWRPSCRWEGTTFAGNTFIDATGGEWTVGVGHHGSTDNRYPILFDRVSVDVTTINGFINGDVCLEAPWEYPGDQGPYINSAALNFRGLSGTARILGWRFERAWDAIRINGMRGRFIIQDCYFFNIRDDAIEAERGPSGVIRNCLFDGVFVMISTSRRSAESADNLIEIENTLVRMKPFLYGYNRPVLLTHLGPFKWTGTGTSPKLSIKNSIFAVGVPRDSSERLHTMGRLRSALNSITHIENSYWLNLTDTPLPDDYPDVAGAGFTVIQGEEARQMWLDARAEWIERENLRRTAAGLSLLPTESEPLLPDLHEPAE